MAGSEGAKAASHGIESGEYILGVIVQSTEKHQFKICSCRLRHSKEQAWNRYFRGILREPGTQSRDPESEVMAEEGRLGLGILT